MNSLQNHFSIIYLLPNVYFSQNKEMFHKKGCRQMDKLNPYIKDLPLALKEKAEKFVHNLALKEKDQNFQEDFLKLMEHKYLCSLAQPGEPVGVLAGQSVGEPSTQMT